MNEAEQRRAALQAEIQLALDELERGEGIDLEEDEIDAYFDEIQAAGRAQYEASRQDQTRHRKDADGSGGLDPSSP